MTQPPTSILICYDGSQTAKDTVMQVAKVFPQHPVVVLNVWKPIETLGYAYAVWVGDVEEINTSIEQQARKISAEGRDLAFDAGLEPRPETVETRGTIGRAIVDRCASGDISVVAIGTVGHSALGGALLGSVSNTVSHHSSVPVLLVHPSSPVEHVAAGEQANANRVLATNK